jgi:hypothetical protein
MVETGTTTLSVATDADGFATVWNWVLGTTEGTNTLAVSAGAVSTAFTVSGTDVHRLTFVTPPPATMIAGVTIATPVVIQVADADGNPLRKSGVMVTVNEEPMAPTANVPQLVGTAEAITDADGRAYFDDLRDSSRVQTVRLAFGATVNSAALPILYSDPITLVAGAATKLVPASATTLSTASNTPLSTYPSVTVTDVAGNPVAGVPLSFTASPPCTIGTPPATDAAGTVTLNASTLIVPLTATAVCTVTASGYVPNTVTLLDGSPLAFSLTVVAAGTSIWTGAASNIWTDAANWVGGLPTPASPVVITRSGFMPRLAADASVGPLILNAGVAFDLGGHSLTVAGDLDAGTGSSGILDGTVLLAGGNASIRGVVPNVVVGAPTCNAATYTLDGTLQVIGDMTLNCGLIFGTQSAAVSGNFATQNGGYLVMAGQSSATLSVAGNATFDGATNMPTDGILSVGGNFTQLGTHTTQSFAPSGGFIVQLDGSGTTTQHVSFSDPQASHFANLFIATPSTVALLSDVHLNGWLTVTAGAIVTQSAPFTLSVIGATVAAPTSDFSGVSHLTTEATDFPSFLGNSPALVTLESPLVMTTDHTITGALELTNALDVRGHHLTVGDSLRVATPQGELITLNPSSVVSVAGDADFAGKPNASRLAKGTLEVGGNFRQSSVNGGGEFGADSAFLVRFNGTKPQTVTFDSPGNGSGQSFFGSVEVLNPAGVTQTTTAAAIVLRIASGDASAPARWTTGENTLIANAIRVSKSGILDHTNGGIESTDCRVYSLFQILGGQTSCAVDETLLGSAARPGLHPAWAVGLRR